MAHSSHFIHGIWTTFIMPNNDINYQDNLFSAQRFLTYNILEGHSAERIYLWQRCFDASKPRISAATGRQYPCPAVRHKTILKPRFAAAANKPSSANTIAEKAIWFRHPDYDPDRAQKLISSSMSRHLLTCNISSKSMYVFLNNLANKQTDRQTSRAITYTSSFVGGKKVYWHTFKKKL